MGERLFPGGGGRPLSDSFANGKGYRYRYTGRNTVGRACGWKFIYKGWGSPNALPHEAQF